MGLVSSLNEALKHVNGKFVARMDADDVSLKNRIEKEYKYLLKNNLDLVGTWIRLIDTRNKYIGEIQFPTTIEGIKKQMKFGGCIARPTWFGKTKVFESLKGYRHMLYCEDYDFLLRALDKRFKLGNISFYGLNYRIRENGISLSNKNMQLIIRRFLSRNIININSITDENLREFIDSKKFSKELSRLNSYEMAKNKLYNFNLVSVVQLITNKNFYIYLHEKFVCYIYRKLYIEGDNNVF